jgi:hypothetical protein
MAAATYDKKPTFLVRELDKILGENDRAVRANLVEAKLPTVQVSSTGSVEVRPPAAAPRRRSRG